MAAATTISTLFLDIGGVLLTNGWDRQSRSKAAQVFNLDFAEFDERHHLTYDTYEEGKLSLNEYLQRVVFYRPRPFTQEEFKAFMFQRSQLYPEMVQLIQRLKSTYHLKTVAVSNEGRELNQYRINKFNLQEVIDSFVSSCYVHLRKPDSGMYMLALDISHAKPEQTIYLDDRQMFIEVAKGMHIHGIHHHGTASTQEALAKFGLV